jgi:hypothetical protein
METSKANIVDGQKYFDEPVYSYATIVATAVSLALRNRPHQPIATSSNRVNIRWMKPDGRGKLVLR